MTTAKKLTVGAAIVALGAAISIQLQPSMERTDRLPIRSSAPVPVEPKRPERPWPISSLGELQFDQTLTLLGNEVERLLQESGGGAPLIGKIEPIVRRLEEMHRENEQQITRAAAYYDSLSPAARARFEQFRKAYRGRYHSLGDLVRALRVGDDEAGRELVELIRRSGAWSPPRPAPTRENLPSRRLAPIDREPRSTQAEWETPDSDDGTVGVAPGGNNPGWFGGLFGTRTAHAQEGDPDLAETPEVKFTPESAPGIQALLDEEDLRGSPAKIANWVRNHVEFVPIRGALQSSVTCLDTRRGTADDIASLTIALLRASGIKARYQAGTVRLPIDLAKNWLGNFESATAAASLVASGGIPAVVQVDTSGEPAFLKFEHVWVRAFVDYVPYRGMCHVAGDTWVDMDTAIRSYDYFDAPDLASVSCGSDLQRFLDDWIDNCPVDADTGEFTCVDAPELNPSLFLCPELDDVIDPSLSLAEMYGVGRVRASDSSVFWQVPEFRVVARGPETAELGPRDRFRIRVSVSSTQGELLAVGYDAAAIGASRLSLTFRTASELDRQILADQISDNREDGLPDRFWVAGVSVITEFRRDGEIAAEAAPVPMGAPLKVTVDFEEPAVSTAPIESHIVAGELTAIGLDLVAVPERLLEEVGQEIRDFGAIILDEGAFDPVLFEEALLSWTVHAWFDQVDTGNRLIASALGSVSHRYPSAGIASAKWLGATTFGLPLAGRIRGVTLDITGDVSILENRDGNNAHRVFAAVQQGFTSSGLEATVPGEIFHYGSDDAPAYFVGTTQALGIARALGDTLVSLGPENLPQVLPNIALDEAAREEIQSAVDRGFAVFAHEASLEDQSTRLAGYAMIDLATGSGVYRMSSGARGTAGGETAECIGREQPQDDAFYNFSRAWQGAVKSDIGATLLQGLNVTKAASAVGILNTVTSSYASNMKKFNAAFTVLGPSAEPLKRLVMLFVALDVLQSLLGGNHPAAKGYSAVFGAAQAVAWQGAVNVITYLIRIESAISSTEIPRDCLRILVGHD